ncbi:acyl-CoA synthetase (AMP-forming)/AMP-acid ligase II [Nocardioides cavernae]|uniref:Acyl-CoA synthetase (AMP-forming)/AMP-acid ligase II n=1 Tax=Nocardioides cavernae TaxID=1921566 RepID=A0A7Y9H0N6_9ACTN|nr:AMP-binding protein [Nocardioides cavernae]NYE35810.1 acyl-CoA synthetase (AMP-forming)/AMP-acid ligase II [Nocardioides cavernae]
MQHRIFVVPLATHLAPAEARRHWEQRHGRVFGATPGLLRYRQNRPVDAEWDAGRARFCSETWYADRAAERAAYDTDHYRETVAADEASFLDREGAWSAVVLDGDGLGPGGGPRILWFDESPPPGPDWRPVRLDRPVPLPGNGTTLHVAAVDDVDAALALTRSTPVVGLVCDSIDLDPHAEEPPDEHFSEPPTVGQMLVRSAERWPEADALVYPDRRVSYAQLLEGARRAGRSFLAQGVRPGERVGILMPNCIEFMELFLGAHLAGAVPVTVNARYKARELRHVVEDAELVALVTTDVVAEFVPFVDLLGRAFAEGRPPRLRTLVLLGRSSPEGYVDQAAWEHAGTEVTDDALDAAGRTVAPDGTAVVMYTSGTTSDPRGCPLSHRALMRTADQVGQRFDLDSEERFWDPLPLFHMAGLLPTLANLLRGGATLSMLHFDAGTALRQLVDERATFAYPAFPTITQSIIHHPGFADADLSRVRGLLESAPPETLRHVQEAFPAAKVVTSYGLTEASGVITFSHLDDPDDLRFTTSGRPFPGVEVRIVDPETGEDCPPGAVGEIRLAGPSMFDGYLNDPAYTASRTDERGFLHTGDLGTLDAEGRISYTGRLKDMLKVGGENVAAAEIEAHLGRHPGVKIAAVVGVADAHLVEVPVAFVERAPGTPVAEEELITHCRGELATFKLPRRVWFVDEWPMSTTKIQKFQLRELAESYVHGGATP